MLARLFLHRRDFNGTMFDVGRPRFGGTTRPRRVSLDSRMEARLAGIGPGLPVIRPGLPSGKDDVTYIVLEERTIIPGGEGDGRHEGQEGSESKLSVAHFMEPQDANIAGNVHGGVIMKHIDSVAGMVAFRHTRSNVVTASIQKLDFFNPVFIGNLLKLTASVNMTGRTSLEVGVRVESEDLYTGEVRHTASAYLTFVALDENHRPRPVPPVILETEDEKRRNREAMERRRGC
jgi:acyl-CoA hydrolase